MLGEKKANYRDNKNGNKGYFNKHKNNKNAKELNALFADVTSGMEDGRSRWRTDDRRSGGQESQVSEETRAGEWCADTLSLEGVLQQFNCV